MKTTWVDVRDLGDAREAVIGAAVHHRVNGVLAGRVEDLAPLPPTVTKVLCPEDGLPDDLRGIDVLLVGPEGPGRVPADLEIGRYIEVHDHASLVQACTAAATSRWTVVRFSDPTKIPLEILLAATDNDEGSIVTVVGDAEEARIVFGVLERGADGVLLAPGSAEDVRQLAAATVPHEGTLELTELEVVATAHLGMGDRACVDTCTYLRPDEGILVGSHARGLILACSETHPLPYMPTRPFRVNAGAIHSYALTTGGRTSYLSELRSGSGILAVDVHGRTRVVLVGRVKIESRPLLSVDAVAGSGETANMIVQDDWHVRLLAPGGAVCNVTELRQGDRLLGYLPAGSRHVGYPIDEFCLEQ